jgi:rhodanese-related sulfurtransferase
MTTETLSKEAIAHFEAKLAFETGPIGLQHSLKSGAPVQIIDLRTPELFAKGHIPGAINILFENFEKETAKFSRDKTIVVYCYDVLCHLSTKAALWLAKKGYKVQELIGGWDGWVEHQLPVEGKAQASSCGSHGSSCG